MLNASHKIESILSVHGNNTGESYNDYKTNKAFREINAVFFHSFGIENCLASIHYNLIFRRQCWLLAVCLYVDYGYWIHLPKCYPHAFSHKERLRRVKCEKCSFVFLPFLFFPFIFKLIFLLTFILDLFKLKFKCWRPHKVQQNTYWHYSLFEHCELTRKRSEDKKKM